MNIQGIIRRQGAPLQARLAAALCLFLVVAQPCRAVLGVVDTVVISGDMTDAWKWPREFAQWQRAASLSSSQLRQLESLRDRMGSASEAVAGLKGTVAKVTEPVLALSKLEDSEDCTQAAVSDPLSGLLGKTLDAEDKVEVAYELFGSKVNRDKGRYVAAGVLLALRHRQAEAEERLGRVVEAEMERQRELLERLKASGTAMELEAVEAALSASQQRLELAKLKVGQVSHQSELMEARLRIEKERASEAARERAEKMVEKLRQRAMTALHAQTGRSL